MFNSKCIAVLASFELGRVDCFESVDINYLKRTEHDIIGSKDERKEHTSLASFTNTDSSDI